MDTHNVSDSPQYVQLLLDQQQKLRDAQARKGQRPTRQPRVQVILQFQLKLMASQAQMAVPKQQTPHMRTSFVPLPYPPCVAPLSSLKKIMIDDLLLETRHRGAYLLVRSVTPQDRMTAVMAIVEDEKGEVLMVQLYHQEDGSVGRAEDILVKGMVLVLKEPYLKLMSDGNYGLRVDHLSDVVFLSANDGRVPTRWQRESAEHTVTALAWKIKGNDHFKSSAYRSAVECYTRALSYPSTPEENQTIRLNRSLVFLRTQQYDAALSDIESVTAATTETAKSPEKALFRKAEALYGLERYRECCEALKKLRSEYPDNTAAKPRLARAISRLAEHTHGKYPFKQLHAAAAELRPPHLDHATYMGPVSIQAAGSRGRGLFTTKAVKAGDLLFCEKAFAHAFIDNEKGRGVDMTLLIDSENGGTMGAQSDLINMTVQKLYRNPSLLSTITGLHHGSYQPVDTTEVDGKPVVDTFLIRRIISLNAFGCPLSTLASHQQPHPTQDPEKEGFHSCGLWPTASYINHSCTSNARRAFIGDMMIARATRDLAPGTEITWWYQVPTAAANSHAERKTTLLRQWGFACDCALCEDEQRTSAAVRAKRKDLVARLEKCLPSLGRGQNAGEEAVVAEIETAVEAMVATYDWPAREVPRLAIWEAMQKALMAVVRMKQVQPIRVAKLILGAFASLGYVIEGGMSGTIVVREWGLLVGGVVAAWMLLRDVYRLAAPELVMPTEGYAKTAYRMVFGEDETFGSYGECWM